VYSKASKGACPGIDHVPQLLANGRIDHPQGIPSRGNRPVSANQAKQDTTWISNP
jgi:hypothetical protein